MWKVAVFVKTCGINEGELFIFYWQMTFLPSKVLFYKLQEIHS